MYQSFEEKTPRVGERVFVDDSARVIGDVELHDDVVVLPGAVIRGDYDGIVIGEGSVVEDCCVLHADEGGLVVGEGVTIGHAAVIHCAHVGDNCLIGMGATLLKDAVIGGGSLVAAGALVTQGTQIPPNSLVMGVPAKVVREVSPEQSEYIGFAADYYRRWGSSCLDGALVEVEPKRLGD